MSDPRTDELTSRMQTLARDADGVALADSADVRRRGTQRRRTAIAASTVAAVVVVAVGASLGAGVLDRPDAAPPATSSSPTPSSDQTVLTLANDPFLLASELGQIGPYESFQRQTSAKPVPLPDCLGQPFDWDPSQTQSASFLSDLEATFTETLLVFDNERQAMDAAKQMNQALKSCYKTGDGQMTLWDGTGPGSAGESTVVRRTDSPQGDGGLDYSELAVARTGNLIIWLDWSSLGSPFADNPGTDNWVWTQERIHAALNRAIVR